MLQFALILSNFYEDLLHGCHGNSKTLYSKGNFIHVQSAKQDRERRSGGCRKDEGQLRSNISHLLCLGNK